MKDLTEVFNELAKMAVVLIVVAVMVLGALVALDDLAERRQHRIKIGAVVSPAFSQEEAVDNSRKRLFYPCPTLWT